MNEKYAATLKSAETEDWLDLHVIRPACYYLAVFFAKLGIHPNTVTIASMFIGAGSAVFFGCASYYYCGISGLLLNLVAIALLMVADIFDCTDGQLARMTGKKSPLGRILDGAAGFTWFVPIYIAMVWRFYQHHDLEFSWLGIADTPQNALVAAAIAFAFALWSGISGIAGQQRLADYYINVHLFFLKGEKGSELDTSRRQQEILDQMTPDTPWIQRWFQNNYVGYTKAQEKATPQFQQLMKRLREKYGDGTVVAAHDIPEDFRASFRQQSLPVIFWNGLLTFNFRSFWLFLFCLIDLPVLYFPFEIFVMGFLTWYVNHRHEGFCRQLANQI